MVRLDERPWIESPRVKDQAMCIASLVYCGLRRGWGKNSKNDGKYTVDGFRY